MKSKKNVLFIGIIGFIFLSFLTTRVDINADKAYNSVTLMQSSSELVVFV